MNKFNSFDKNLKFTVDNFENGKIYLLDLEISNSGIDVSWKSTHMGQYTRFDSFEPWSRKTAWVRSLFHQAVNICSNLTFSKFISWNGFPANVTLVAPWLPEVLVSPPVISALYLWGGEENLWRHAILLSPPLVQDLYHVNDWSVILGRYRSNVIG